MSGHSKWSTIKRKKEANDQKKGAAFTKLVKAISVAVKTGGGPNPETNFKLRLAIDKAKSASMPLSNIENAIKKASGDSKDNSQIEEILYEGYSVAKVAIIAEALTDNRNRTAAEIRHVFSKHGGNLGAAGCVGWMFDPRGFIMIPATADQQDDLCLGLMEMPIENLEQTEDGIEITTTVENFEPVKKQLEDQSIKYSDAELIMIPQTTVEINDPKLAKQILNLIEALEDNEDIQNVYANFDIPQEILERIAE